VFLVHRPNLEQLDEACRYIQSCFRRPAWVEREQDYAWLAEKLEAFDQIAAILTLADNGERIGQALSAGRPNERRALAASPKSSVGGDGDSLRISDSRRVHARPLTSAVGGVVPDPTCWWCHRGRALDQIASLHWRVRTPASSLGSQQWSD